MHPFLFMSLYALFNLYIWFIGYAYSPCLGPNSIGGEKQKEDPSVSKADKEKQTIMNEFYERELVCQDDDEDEERSTTGSNLRGKATSKIQKEKQQKNPYQKEV